LTEYHNAYYASPPFKSCRNTLSYRARPKEKCYSGFGVLRSQYIGCRPPVSASSGGSKRLAVRDKSAKFRERTQAGLKAAKNRSAKLGRKPSLSEDQRKQARELLDRGESPATAAKLLNVCRATLYNSMKR
jgi:hypothetical protein